MPLSRPSEDQALDRWIRDCLREQHAAVLNEPMPDSLLRLLGEHRGTA